MPNENDKKIRSRNWFLTINPNAECYKKIKDIISSYKYNHFAMIYHEKDEENENDQHIHIVLELQNPRSFEAIQSKFIGAHIEQVKFKFQAYKYLIHLENDNKRKYHVDDIITDNIDYYKECIKSDEYEKLETQTIFNDIYNGINTITEFVRKYGLYQVSRFTGILSTMIRENQYIERINDLENKIRELKAEKEELQEINKQLQNEIDKDLPF